MPSKNVNTPIAAYVWMAAAWKLPLTLMGGTEAMRAAGEDYLPKEPKEEPAEYIARLGRSWLFNGFRRTIVNMVGKVFSAPIGFAEDTPKEILQWSTDIDLAGRRLDDFARDLFSDAAQGGLSHILIDIPTTKKQVQTREQEKQLGKRPYFVHIKAEDLIGWRSENINGKETLTQIRFRETITKPDDDYGNIVTETVKVVERDNFKVFQKDETLSTEMEEIWVIIEEGELSLGEIPLVTFYTNRTGFMRADPPLEDLAQLNAAHWQSASDQRHILHVARVPILFYAGAGGTDANGEATTDAFEVGPNSLVTASNSDAKLTYVEHGGEAIDSGRQDLLDTEDRMRIMGLELFMPKAGTQTATGKAIDSAEHNSFATSLALGLQYSLDTAFGFLAKMGGIQVEEINTKVNTDFGISLHSTKEFSDLLNSCLAGKISQETFLSELKRRKILTAELDITEEMERTGREMVTVVELDDEDEIKESELEDEEA